jgi:malonate-semialdehyde dehydrogenase (acetylating)/methylmalonate-semialdehyde dehydrogenase
MQVTTNYDTASYRFPLGVCAGIVPLNFPAMIPWGWMVPLAIVCGNTVVLKANSQTPLTSMRMLELFYEEAGFPKGVVNLVTTNRVQAELFMTDPRIKAITFVGTTGVGKHIYSVGAANGKRVQAQTEAKNHALVLEDCNLEASVNAIINSSFGCAGMRCMALPVIVVQESIADDFVALFKKKAQALRVGCAYKEETQLGPVVSAGHKKKVCDWIQKGIDEGATVVLDGRDIVVPGYENGFFVGPTILDNVKPGMTVGDREIFGPVTVIKRVKNFEEGIALMNANPFANGSVIFTQSGYYARQFEMLTDGGMVGINVGIPVPSAYFPFSGNKDSFYGDQHVLGLDGIRFYTRAKTVTKHWYNEESRKKAMDTWEGTVERI